MKKGMQKEYLQSFKACKDIIFKNITETTFSSPKILKKILEINEWLFSISGVRCYKTNEQPKPAITFRFCDPINGANEDPFLRINYRPQSGSVIFFADEKTKVKAPEYMEKTKKNRPWLEVKAQDIDRLSIEKFKKHIIDAYKDKYKKSPKIQSLSIASNTPHLLINKDTLLDDIKDIILNKSLNETEKETKVLCRIGQGIFRENLIRAH